MSVATSTRLGAFEPWIVFDYLCFRCWVRDGLTLEDVHEETERLRKGAKDGTGYGWDNRNFKVRSLQGQICLSVLFNEDGFSVWDARGNSIGDWDRLDSQTVEELRIVIEQVQSGRRNCNECRGWFDTGRRYSFAGFVCNECYDPKRHTRPDTRGD